MLESKTIMYFMVLYFSSPYLKVKVEVFNLADGGRRQTDYLVQ
jgi:hypothetical protein